MSRYELAFRVNAGPCARIDSMVSYPLNIDNLLWHEGCGGKMNPASLEVWELHQDGMETKMISQVTDSHVHWIMAGKTEPNTTKRFAVRFDTGEPLKGKLNPMDQLILTDMGTELLAIKTFRDADHARSGGMTKELCRYKYRNVWKPYFHPVNGPDGPVTRGEVFNEEDHPFHHGIWLAYGGMEAEGTNLWAESDQVIPRRGMTGRMEHQSFEHIRYGKVFAEFKEHVHYRKPDGFPFAREQRTIRILAPNPKMLFIDWEILLEEPDDKGLRNLIFSARVADSMRIRDLCVRTPDHPKTMGTIRDKPGAIESGTGWADFSGPVGNGWNGIALFDHPDNPEFPLKVSVSEYGLFGGMSRPYPAITSRGGAFYIKYRAYIHDGNAQTGMVQEAFHDYTHPCIAIYEGFGSAQP